MAVYKRGDRKNYWVAEFKDATGKWRRFKAPTRQLAQDLFATKRAEANEDKGKEDGAAEKSQYEDYTVSQYVPVFLDRARKEKLSAATRRSYEQLLRVHVVPALGEVLVREMTVEKVSRFLSAKRDARFGVNKEKGREGKPYGKNAVRLMRAALSSLLTDAVEVDFLLTANPCLSVKFQKKRHQAKEEEDAEPNPMTGDQLDAFLSQALLREQQGVLPYRVRIMWALRAKTGLRPEEAFALHTDSIDWTSKLLRVRAAVSYGVLKKPKTKASKRDVQLSDGLMALLEDYVDYVKAEAVALGQPEPHWLFPGRDGGLVTEPDERFCRDLFHQVRKAAGLPLFTPYDLRATYASLLCAAGNNILKIAKQMGHTNATMLMKHYAKDVDEETRFTNVLDRPPKIPGTKNISGTKKIEGKESEGVEIRGGPCWGRTYGPLIKSERQGMTQVVEDLGHPLSHLADRAFSKLLQFVPLHLIPSCLVA
ncbi:MAG: site-specific integrase [Nitrospirales bacterium]